MNSPFLYAVPDDIGAARPTGTIIGRIARVYRGACDVLTRDGEIRAEFVSTVSSSTSGELHLSPCVGDLCIVDLASSPPRIVELLPRRSAITRAAVSPGSSQRQVLAANVDVLGIVEPLSSPPVLGRIERLLTLAWESGAQPLVVLSKSDLDSDPDEWVSEVEGIAPGASVVAVSAPDGTGVEQLQQLLNPGVVLAFVGPSGAGKSSLVNVLAGDDVMAIAEIRHDGRGRHTTTHRELVVLPSGSLVIDTPGLRSIGLASPEALGHVFADVIAFAELCRFNDCAHESEPDCGVLDAIEQGELPARRFDSWRKLQREAAYQERRTNVRLRAAEREVWKRRTREYRQRGNR